MVGGRRPASGTPPKPDPPAPMPGPAPTPIPPVPGLPAGPARPAAPPIPGLSDALPSENPPPPDAPPTPPSFATAEASQNPSTHVSPSDAQSRSEPHATAHVPLLESAPQADGCSTLGRQTPPGRLAQSAFAPHVREHCPQRHVRPPRSSSGVHGFNQFVLLSVPLDSRVAHPSPRTATNSGSETSTRSLRAKSHRPLIPGRR